MKLSLDFKALTGALHEAPGMNVEQKARDGISPYLLETILPMLLRDEPPRLRDIAFDRFDLEDPPNLVGYVRERGQRVYQLTSLNRELCGLPPACVNTRAFL